MGHPIGIVSRATGLSTHVIRAWEKRYGVVTPRRAPRGRRLYSEAEIERLAQLARAVRAGWGIGDVARLSPPDLERLLASGGTDGSRGAASMSAPGNLEANLSVDSPKAIVDSCVLAVERLDPDGLKRTLSRGRVSLGALPVVEEVIAPLMRRLGEEWRARTLRILHEHLATGVTRSFLGDMLLSFEPHQASPAAVAATLPGERHELGIIAAAVAASAEGWRVKYLGPDIPAEEIARAAQIAGARAVLLGLTYAFDDYRGASEVREIAGNLPPGAALIAGGTAAEAHLESLRAEGVLVAGDLKTFRGQLLHLARGETAG